MKSTPVTGQVKHGARAAGTRARVVAIGAVAISLGAALSGCSLLENDAWAVSYEITAVTGAAADASVAVEYTDRASRGAEQTKVSQSGAVGGGPVVYESIALLDEPVSVSAAAIPGVALRCEIKLDGDRVIAEAESEAGNGVDCAATTPSSLDD